MVETCGSTSTGFISCTGQTAFASHLRSCTDRITGPRITAHLRSRVPNTQPSTTGQNSYCSIHMHDWIPIYIVLVVMIVIIFAYKSFRGSKVYGMFVYIPILGWAYCWLCPHYLSISGGHMVLATSPLGRSNKSPISSCNIIH